MAISSEVYTTELVYEVYLLSVRLQLFFLKCTNKHPEENISSEGFK